MVNKIDEFLEDALKRTSVVVEFTKANGEKRTMICTRNMRMIPVEFHPKDSEYKSHNKNDEQVRVFDFEKSAWRSFKASSVISWKKEFEQPEL